MGVRAFPVCDYGFFTKEAAPIKILAGECYFTPADQSLFVDVHFFRYFMARQLSEHVERVVLSHLEVNVPPQIMQVFSILTLPESCGSQNMCGRRYSVFYGTCIYILEPST